MIEEDMMQLLKSIYEVFKENTVFLTVLLSLSSLLISINQYRTAKTSYIQINRPNLTLNRIVLDNPNFRGLSTITGKIRLLNSGNIDAEILDSAIVAYVTDKPLPQDPDMTYGNLFNQPFFQEKYETTRHAPGVKAVLGVSDVLTGRFESQFQLSENQATSIQSADTKWNLYVIGYIGYRGVTGEKKPRILYRNFAFKYCGKNRRFNEILDDQDYNYDTGKIQK